MQSLKTSSCCLLEAELGHVELQVRLVEEAQHDLLAEERRQRRDAEVHLLAASHLQLDAAVLRQAPLGDVQLRHDLEPRRDRVAQLHRRLHHLVEHAVDAVADAEFLLVRLDVDVRRVALDGVGEDQVHELDDRRVLGLARQLADVDVVLVLDQLEVFDVEVRHHVRERGGLVVVLVDRGLDRLFRGDDDLDVVPGEELDVVDREDVRRIGGGEDQRGAGAVHRNHGVLDRHLFRDQLDDVAIDLELGEFDRRQPVLLGDELGELGFLEVTELGDLVAEASAVGARLVAGALQLLGRQHVLTDEQLADPLVHRVPSPAASRARTRAGLAPKPPSSGDLGADRCGSAKVLHSRSVIGGAEEGT